MIHINCLNMKIVILFIHSTVSIKPTWVESRQWDPMTSKATSFMSKGENSISEDSSKARMPLRSIFFAKKLSISSFLA